LSASTWARAVDQNLPPELLRMFYPRKYACPGGYASPKLAARIFALHCRPEFIRNVERGEPIEGGVEASVFACGGRLASLGMPTYWVTRDLAQAAAQTSPPETLKLADIKFPMDGMLFMLPEGTLDPPGQQASWLAVAKAQNREGKVSVAFVTGGFGPTYATTLRSEEPLSSFDSLPFETFVPSELSIIPPQFPDAGVEEDTKFTKRACHLGTTLLMLMNARPELVAVETQADAPTTPEGRTPRNKLFAPNWVGRDYRIVRRGEAEGTHASPVMHWRRGHWRHQPFGPERRERKDIWIEPCLVGHE